jgi:hypothetical protein
MSELIKELTCKERITSQLESEEANLKEIYDAIDGTGEVQDYEDAQEALYEYALGMSTRKETVITLSWGGPAYYIEVVHEGADIIRAVYRFSDWFDTATQELDEESSLYRYAQELINISEENI